MISLVNTIEIRHEPKEVWHWQTGRHAATCAQLDIKGEIIIASR